MQQGRKMSFPLKLLCKSFPFLTYTLFTYVTFLNFLLHVLGCISFTYSFGLFHSSYGWKTSHGLHFLALLTLEWSVFFFSVNDLRVLSLILSTPMKNISLYFFLIMSFKFISMKTQACLANTLHHHMKIIPREYKQL